MMNNVIKHLNTDIEFNEETNTIKINATRELKMKHHLNMLVK